MTDYRSAYRERVAYFIAGAVVAFLVWGSFAWGVYGE